MENLWTSLIQVSAAFFMRMIQVIPYNSPIITPSGCGYSNVPILDQINGVSNSDFQLYVAIADNLAGQRWLDAVVCTRISNIPRSGGFTFFQ